MHQQLFKDFSLSRRKSVAKAASKFGTTEFLLSTVSVEEIEKISNSPKMFQFYFHKDRALNQDLLDRAKNSNFDVSQLWIRTEAIERETFEQDLQYHQN